MQIINTYIVQAANIPNRLLDFVIVYVSEISTRNGAKKAIKRGEIKVNNEVANTATFLKVDDLVSIHEPSNSIGKVFELKLDILYEDEYLAVILKPSGISVSGNYFRTIQNALPFNLSISNQPDKLIVPRPVHRLDNPTSGLLVIAKTSKTNILLGEMLAGKNIHKVYNALVLGQPNTNGKITINIQGKSAKSKYQTIETKDHSRFGKISLVELSPITGRTHQLRIHMAQTGTPILGDKEYGNDVKNLWGKGLYLCATKITFMHPITNEQINIGIGLPNKFTKILKQSM